MMIEEDEGEVKDFERRITLTRAILADFLFQHCERYMNNKRIPMLKDRTSLVSMGGQAVHKSGCSAMVLHRIVWGFAPHTPQEAHNSNLIYG
jgi:hypothetical protein